MSERLETTRPFERQTVVRPNLMAFHATTALLVASARDLPGRDVGVDLTDYGEALEEWIAGIKESNSRTAEASDVSAVSRAVRKRKAIERFVRDHPELNPPANLNARRWSPIASAPIVPTDACC